MVLQPIIDITSGRVVAAEALARFGDETRSITEVFASAYAHGHGMELEAACVLAARKLRDTIAADVILALNISPDALDDPHVERALAGDLGGLIVELTEHPASRPTAVADHVADLRRRGALVAVDDVTTGYAGLMRLARLRPDLIKVDRRVVTGLTGSIEQIAVIEALVSMARRLGSLVLAEGVESSDDLVTLAGLDVDYAQGFAIAPPAAVLDPIPAQIIETCRETRQDLLRLSRPAITGSAGRSILDLHQVTAALGGAAGYGEVEPILSSAADVMGSTFASVSLLDDGAVLREVLASGDPVDPTPYALADYPETAQALQSGVMLEVQRGEAVQGGRGGQGSRAGTGTAEHRLLEQLGMASLLLVPLMVDGRPIGILELTHATPHRWTARDIGLARALSDHLARALVRLSHAKPGP